MMPTVVNIVRNSGHAGGLLVAALLNVLVFPPAIQGAELLSVAAVAEKSNQFIVTVSHELCTNAVSCVGDAASPLGWFIVSDDRTSSLGVQSVEISGTNVVLTSFQSRLNARIYRVGVATNGGGVFDISGNPIAPGSYVRTVASFQQGFGGYFGTQDTFLDETLPSTPLGFSNSVSMRLGNNTSRFPTQQGLLRFDELFGEREDQIPIGAIILRATLFLVCETEDDTTMGWFDLHRMRRDWNQSNATWNSFNGGIGYRSILEEVLDPSEIEPEKDATIHSWGGFPNGGSPGTGAVDVTRSLSAWSNGKANYGWGIIFAWWDSSWDRYGFSSSEHENAPYRPKLEVDYVVPLLSVRHVGSARILNWDDSSYVLQVSTSLNSPDWQSVLPAPATEYQIPIDGVQRFYRLCVGCQ